jgi:hypothetical protein
MPNIPALLTVLIEHKVAFVLAGSVAVQAWGADIGTAGDLDIVPDTRRANLCRLARALSAIDATPFPVSGEWRKDSGELVWHEFPVHDPRRNGPAPVPTASNSSTFDTLFHTRLGTLDIVPRILGEYDDIVRRSSLREVEGIANVQVMSIEDLLVHLTRPRRDKDVSKVMWLRALQRARFTTSG